MPAVSGVEIVVSRTTTAGKKRVWAAECAGLLPFVSETGDTPRAAVVRFLRRVANYYERHEHEPLPEVAVRIWPSRRRVIQIATISPSPEPIYYGTTPDDLLRAPVGQRATAALSLVVVRRRMGSLTDETRSYRYTARRWAVLEEAFRREYGNAHARRMGGRPGFSDEDEEE